MTNKIVKRIWQAHACKKSLGLLVIATLFVSIFIAAISVQPVIGAWLGDWNHRRLITVNKSDVAGDLTDFPVLVYLSASSGEGKSDVTSIFDVVGSDYNAIAFANEGGERYYFEVERWDSINKKAWIWVKLNVSSVSDTSFYIYYDSTKNGSTYADSTKVWDSHFKAVYHMRDKTASTIEDSTGNNNDGTKKAANEPQEISSFIDKGQHFDGTNDNIGCGNDTSLIVGKVTLEAFVVFDSVPGPTDFIGVLGRWDPPANKRSYTFYVYAQQIRLAVSDDGTWTAGHRAECHDGTLVSTTAQNYYAGTYDTSPKIYRNGTDVTVADWDEIDGNALAGTAALTLGCNLNTGVPYRFLNGKLDEVRISDIARSAAWIKATYETERDHFLTYGTEDTFSRCTLNSPSSGTTVTEWTVNFNYTPRFEVPIENCSLWLNLSGTWQRAQWNTTSVQNDTENTISYTFSTEGTYVWNIEVFNSTGSIFASLNWTIIVDVPPRVRNVGSNSTSIPENGTILLHSQGYDDIGLDQAWLATNETGSWKNYTMQSIWSLGSNLLEPLADHVSVVYSNSSGDYIYVFGGYNATGWEQLIDRVYVYDLAADTWSLVNTKMPTGGVRYAGIQVGKGIYLFGGRLPGGTALNHTSVYFPENNTWNTAKSDMPYGAFSHGICYDLNGDGLIHVFGGYNHITGQLSAHTTYNVASDTFDTSPADLPDGRQGFAWGVYNGKLYVIAGVRWTGSGYAGQDDVFCYDSSSNTWTSKTPLPVNRGGSMGYTQIGEYMYWVEGWGGNVDEHFYKEVYRYSFVDDEWTKVTDGFYANDGNWICTIGNKLYVTGGRNESGAHNWLQVMKQDVGRVVDLNGVSQTWAWSNFTWSNSSIAAGTTIQWKIYYNDTHGQVVGTGTLTFAVTSGETGPPSIIVDPAVTDAALGNDYVIHVNVTNAIDLYAWEFQLSYNPAILDLTSTAIVTGGINEPTQTFYSLTDEISGHLWWAVSTTYPTTSGITYSEHAIFEIRFHTIGIGTSNLELYGTFLSYSNGTEIIHTVANGTIHIDAPDLIVTGINVLNLGCSLYKNDTYANGTTYFYPVEVAIQNIGNISADGFYVKLEVYWVTGSLLEGSQEIFIANLNEGATTVANFTGLFHPMQTGYYRLTATVDSRANISESNETNNVRLLDNVKVTVIGDLNGDSVVDILDGVRISLAWDSTPIAGWWNIKADLNHNDEVSILDAARASLHWGETM
jgi:hypothetical protein